jgi:hypothetical protein
MPNNRKPEDYPKKRQPVKPVKEQKTQTKHDSKKPEQKPEDKK